MRTSAQPSWSAYEKFGLGGKGKKKPSFMWPRPDSEEGHNGPSRMLTWEKKEKKNKRKSGGGFATGEVNVGEFLFFGQPVERSLREEQMKREGWGDPPSR